MTVKDYFDVVNDWNADPTGVIDSTAAINNGIIAAKVSNPGGFEVWFPPGVYSVSSINATKTNSIRLIGKGGPSAVTINGSKQTTPAAILDYTGSAATVTDNIVFAGSATAEGAPLAGILLAATTQNEDSDANRIDNCGSYGMFASAPLCIIGSPCNQVYSSRFCQYNINLPCLNISTNPDWYITSLYQSITQNSAGTNNVGKNSFHGCEFHMFPSGTGGTSSNCWTIYGRNIDEVSFHGCLVSSSFTGQNQYGGYPGYICLQGNQNNALSFFGGGFYSDTGAMPASLLWNDGSLQRFISIGVDESPAYTGTRVVGTAPSDEHLLLKRGFMKKPLYLLYLLAAIALLACMQTPAYAGPIGNAIASSQTATAASSLIAKATGGYLQGFSVTSGASSGYVLIFDSATVPADGTVTPKFCYILPAYSTTGASWVPYSAPLTNGIVIVFSTTGCFSKTASATSFISAQVQ